MSKKEYNTKDIGPIVLYVVEVALGGIVLHVFQVALQGRFKDLSNLIINDTVDEVTYALIDLLEDEVSVSYKICIEILQHNATEIANLYEIEALTNKRIINLGEKFCYHLVRLNIPSGCLEDALYFLSEYTVTTLGILHWLCVLIKKERIDVDSLNNKPDRFSLEDLEYECNGHMHLPVIQAILQIGRQLEKSNQVALAALKKIE